MTDENDSCRSYDSKGKCVASDYVFGLDEQVQKNVDNEARQVSVLVKAGHVEIVGDTDIAPKKLINILQQQGVLSNTPQQLEKELSLLLGNLYENPARTIQTQLD